MEMGEKEDPGASEKPGVETGSEKPDGNGSSRGLWKRIRKALFLLFLGVWALVVLGVVLIEIEAYVPGIIPADWLDFSGSTGKVEQPAGIPKPLCAAPAEKEPVHPAGGGNSESKPDRGSDGPPGNGRFGRIDGYVSDSSGAPVPNAVVWCQTRLGLPPFGTWETCRERKTDENGCFHIRKLKPEEYRILVFDKNAVVVSEVLLDESSKEERLNIVFQMKGRLKGVVSDVSGKPVEGAGIRVFFLGPSLSFYPDHFTNKVVTGTDKTGGFFVDDVPPGEITIKVSRRGYESKTFPGLKVKENETRSERIVLDLSATVEGVIRLGGRKTVAKSGLLVRCYFIHRDDGLLMTQCKDIEDVAPDGRYVCEIEAFQGKPVLFVRANGFRPVWVPLRLERGDRKAMDLHLEERGGILKGKIILPEGRRIKIRDIKISKQHDSETEEYNDDRIWEPISIEADKEGNFFCDFLDRCRYSVSFYFMKPRGGYWETERAFVPDVTDMVIEVPKEW